MLVLCQDLAPMDKITVREWINKFNNGEFDKKDYKTRVMQAGMIGSAQMMH